MKLVQAAKARGLRLRQSYLRVGKAAAVKASRCAHAKHFKRMRRQLRKLRTYVGRLLRDIQRKVGTVDEDLSTLPGPTCANCYGGSFMRSFAGFTTPRTRLEPWILPSPSPPECRGHDLQPLAPP